MRNCKTLPSWSCKQLPLLDIGSSSKLEISVAGSQNASVYCRTSKIVSQLGYTIIKPNEILPDKWDHHVKSTTIDLVGYYTFMTTTISVTLSSVHRLLFYFVGREIS